MGYISFQSSESNWEAALRLSFLVIGLILPVLTPGNVHAVTCHCFKEREFKPSQPSSADPYILATTRNSLVAAAAWIEKRTVVKLRMRGTTETDLWLSSFLSTRVNIPAEYLLDARDNASSWPSALDSISLDTKSLRPAFNNARKAKDADGMVRALADTVLGKTFGAKESTLLLLRNEEANIAESALSLYLSANMKRTPEEIFKEVRKGKLTWGSLLNSQDIKVDTIGDLIAEKVRKAGR